MRYAYCRHDACTHRETIIAGKFPPVCPGCKRASHWVMDAPPTPEPKPVTITKDDGEFLRSIKIAPWVQAAEDDGA